MRLPVRLLGVMIALAGTTIAVGGGLASVPGTAGRWNQQGGLAVFLAGGWAEEGLVGKVGAGYASPIGVKGIIYTFVSDGAKEGLSAFNAADGKPLWSKSYDAAGKCPGGYNGTRTPTCEDGKIYTMGEVGQVTCWDADDAGKILWQTNLLKEAGTKPLYWGAASNPLNVGDHLYFQTGETGPLVVGVDKKTGKMDWKSEAKGKCGYAQPILVEVEGVKEIVVMGGKAVYGVSLENGKTLWQQPWETSYDVNATTPLYRDGHLWVSSGYGHGSMMLTVTAKGVVKEWENKELGTRFQGLVLDGDYVYGNSEGKLKCVQWPSGKLVWSEDLKLNEGGSVLKAGDKLLVLGQRGKLHLLTTDGATHKVMGEASIFDVDRVWSTPLLYDGKLYAMGGDELACFELGAK